MLKLGDFRIYYGTENLGWRMYGIGYRSIWFLGYYKNTIKVKE